jgi:hypothetical protein
MLHAIADRAVAGKACISYCLLRSFEHPSGAAAVEYDDKPDFNAALPCAAHVLVIIWL